VARGVLDLISRLNQLLFSLDCPFDTGLRPTQGASSGSCAVVSPDPPREVRKTGFNVGVRGTRAAQTPSQGSDSYQRRGFTWGRIGHPNDEGAGARAAGARATLACPGDGGDAKVLGRLSGHESGRGVVGPALWPAPPANSAYPMTMGRTRQWV
jgi:hypothetical protein